MIDRVARMCTGPTVAAHIRSKIAAMPLAAVDRPDLPLIRSGALNDRAGDVEAAGFTLSATRRRTSGSLRTRPRSGHAARRPWRPWRSARGAGCRRRSEEHTSELQSRRDLVCRLLLEK